MRRRLRSLFRQLHSTPRSFREFPDKCRYIFRYFSDERPYVTLPLMISQESIIPVALKSRTGYGSSTDYKTMINRTLSPNRDYLGQYLTRGNRCFAVGPGCIYAMPNRDSDRLIPIFVMVMSQHRYEQQGIDEWMNNDKHYLEVFFHHHIRGVNSTLWGYIRNLYIPLLQLEGIRFQFMPPHEIMDLTTISYQKPKFESLGEMKQYKQEVSKMASLKNVFSDTAILDS